MSNPAFRVMRRSPVGHILYRACSDGEWCLLVVPYGKLRHLFGIISFRSAGSPSWDADGLMEDLYRASRGAYGQLAYHCFRTKCEAVPSSEYR